MKITTILFPVIFLVSCVFLLIMMNQYSIIGGDWNTINEWILLLIPALIGLIVGLYILFNRR